MGNRVGISWKWIVGWVLLLASAPLFAAESDPNDPRRFEKDIQAFEAQDQKVPAPPQPILFVGSSSIRLWDLEKSFPGLPLLNRGFGGSQIADSVYYADRVILPYHPKLIVFFAGENDLAAGKSPEEVSQDFRALAKTIRAGLPRVPILYISIKPSPSRWHLLEKMQRTNELIEKYIKKQKNMKFINIFPLMLDDRGLPRVELFQDDRLHLNPDGYRLWAETLRPYLK